MSRCDTTAEDTVGNLIAHDTVTIQLIAFRILLIAVAAVLAVTAARADTPPENFFPIGVYWQPTSSFSTWKARGINTVIGFYNRPDWRAEFDTAAAANGLWMIRNPQENPAADINTPHLLAFSQPDEPDINGIPLATLAANYAQWKAAAPNIPVIENFSGQNAMYKYQVGADAEYANFIKTTDWVSNDVYPITAWNRPDWIDKNAQLNLNDPINNGGIPFNPGNAVDKLRARSNGKQQLAYIETSFQNLSSSASTGARGATAAEVRGETWDAIIHGAKGIVYFPQSFSPDQTDATPPDVVASITQTDAIINQMGGALNSDSNANSNYLNLPGGLEATWRVYQGKLYYFVLNFSHSAANQAKVTLTGLSGTNAISVTNEGRDLSATAGTITDTFAPYQLHIYETTTPVGFTSLMASPGNGSIGQIGSAVPEPSGIVLLGLTVGALLRRRR